MNVKIADSIKITKFRPDADINNGCVLAVGTFDGVHLGHRSMLGSLIDEAKRLSLPAAVFTFETDDSPKNEAKLLALHGRKMSLLAELGVDIVFSAPFSLIRDTEADVFAEKLLFGILNTKSIVCGYDFRFGKDRKGSAALIKELLSARGVSVVTPPAAEINGIPISSTHIRSVIAEGDVAKAAELLGRPFSFESEVIHGAKLGRTLGFPTVNQKYPSLLAVPKFGVYAAVCRVDGKTYGGVANVGVKPTVGGEKSPLCETHLFDYSGDCYGKSVETEFIAFIRPEQRFENLGRLKSQVERDMLSAKEILLKGVIR